MSVDASIAPAGRFCPETVNAFLSGKLAGESNVRAAARAKITHRAAQNWIRRGRAGDDRYLQFVQALEQIERDRFSTFCAQMRAAIDAGVRGERLELQRAA